MQILISRQHILSFFAQVTTKWPIYLALSKLRFNARHKEVDLDEIALCAIYWIALHSIVAIVRIDLDLMGPSGGGVTMHALYRSNSSNM